MNFLLHYTTTSEECSPSMRAYLGSLLTGDDEHEIRMRLERGLQSQSMIDIGVGEQLRNFLLKYDVGNTLWPDGRFTPTPPAAPTSQEYRTRTSLGLDEERRHWSAGASKVFGATTPVITEVLRLEDERHARPDSPDQHIIDEVLLLMRKRLGEGLGTDAQQPRGTGQERRYQPFAGNAVPRLGAIPAEVSLDVENVSLTFDAATGTVVMNRPGDDGQQRAGTGMDEGESLVQSAEAGRSDAEYGGHPSILTSHPPAETEEDAAICSPEATAPESQAVSSGVDPSGPERGMTSAAWTSPQGTRIRVVPKEPRSTMHFGICIGGEQITIRNRPNP